MDNSSAFLMTIRTRDEWSGSLLKMTNDGVTRLHHIEETALRIDYTLRTGIEAILKHLKNAVNGNGFSKTLTIVASGASGKTACQDNEEKDPEYQSSSASIEKTENTFLETIRKLEQSFGKITDEFSPLIDQVTDYDEKIRRVVVNSEDYRGKSLAEREEGQKLVRSIVEEATNKGGGTDFQAASALDALTSKKVSMGAAKDALPSIMKVASISDNDGKAIAKILLEQKDKLKINESELGRTLENAVVLGRAAGENYKNVEEWLPKYIERAYKKPSSAVASSGVNIVKTDWDEYLNSDKAQNQKYDNSTNRMEKNSVRNIAHHVSEAKSKVANLLNEHPELAANLNLAKHVLASGLGIASLWIPEGSGGGAAMLPSARALLPVAGRALGSMALAALPLGIMYGVTQWAGDTSHDTERVAFINKYFSQPLRKMGFGKAPAKSAGEAAREKEAIEEQQASARYGVISKVQELNKIMLNEKKSFSNMSPKELEKFEMLSPIKTKQLESMPANDLAKLEKIIESMKIVAEAARKAGEQPVVINTNLMVDGQQMTSVVNKYNKTQSGRN